MKRVTLVKRFAWDGTFIPPAEVKFDGKVYFLDGLWSGKREPKSKWPFEPKVGMKYWAVYFVPEEIQKMQFIKKEDANGPRIDEEVAGRDYTVVPPAIYRAWLKEGLFKEIEDGVGVAEGGYKYYEQKNLPTTAEASVEAASV